jgi:hypothetical protein
MKILEDFLRWCDQRIEAKEQRIEAKKKARRDYDTIHQLWYAATWIEIGSQEGDLSREEWLRICEELRSTYTDGDKLHSIHTESDSVFGMECFFRKEIEEERYCAAIYALWGVASEISLKDFFMAIEGLHRIAANRVFLDCHWGYYGPLSDAEYELVIQEKSQGYCERLRSLQQTIHGESRTDFLLAIEDLHGMRVDWLSLSEASELETTYACGGYSSYEEYQVERSTEIAEALADAMNTVHKYIPSLQKWRDDHPE